LLKACAGDIRYLAVGWCVYADDGLILEGLYKMPGNAEGEYTAVPLGRIKSVRLQDDINIEFTCCLYTRTAASRLYTITFPCDKLV
jgi:hypothetical protein